ncbi:MAG TPA: 23S rRNA (guanosine(2251)-2'-O)-methyltransferase RlmB [Azospirillaceae bacterium]|nr:23S rRNA (guanosine(2251)-2'-O)-methyltransferase RlmB [Azospirillaceae bacterium]
MKNTRSDRRPRAGGPGGAASGPTGRPPHGKHPGGKGKPRPESRAADSPSDAKRGPKGPPRPRFDRPDGDRFQERPARAEGGERREGAREDRRDGQRDGGRGQSPRPGGGRGGHLLYGLHAVAAAWTNPKRKVKKLFVTESGLEALDPAMEAAHELDLDRPELVLMDKDGLDRMLPPGAVHQGMAVEVAPLPELDVVDLCENAGPTDIIVVLDQVTDPHNVGAILRSAAAFGAKAVVVQDRHAPEVTGVLARTASGALEVVPIVRATNLSRALSELREAGFWCVGLAEEGARALHEVDLSGRTALVLGSEGEGLRRLTAERCDELAFLPTKPPIGSLNVSNAAAVALYEVARRR